jgi:hypothetical protein
MAWYIVGTSAAPVGRVGDGRVVERGGHVREAQTGIWLIARGQTIDGVDIVAMRALLRRFRGYGVTAAGFELLMEQATEDALAVFELLDRHGLTAAGADPRGAARPGRVGIRPRRGAVADHGRREGAGQGPHRRPDARDWAEALLNALIRRAREVNEAPEGLIWVASVDLDGSLTRPDASWVGDVDLRVVFRWRYSGDELVGRLDREWPGRGVVDAATTCNETGARTLERRIPSDRRPT